MSKKSGSLPLYLIGMILVAVGFFLPIFKVSIGPFSGSTNGFDLVGNGNSMMKIAALLVFAGAVVGVICSFINKGGLLKLLALIVSIAGGLYCFFNTSSTAHSILFKIVGVGFYLIIAGWVIALLGYLASKK